MKPPQKKTRILAVGDIHGDTGLVKRLAKKAEQEKVDLVILAGDITFMDQETDNLIAPFVKVKKQVLLIPGNHEPPETTQILSEIYPHTANIHGYAFKRGDLGIFGAGTVDWGIENQDTRNIFKLLKKGNEQVKNSKKKIMVTHMHPRGGKAEFSGFKGSKAVSRAIKELQPDILISAHIHEAGGIEETIGKTKVINVSRKPKIFEI